MFKLAVASKKSVAGITVALIGAIVVLSVVCVTVGFVGVGKTNELQNKYDQLQVDSQNLNASYIALQSTYNQLQTMYDQLKSSGGNTQLQNNYNRLQEQYNQLLAKLPPNSGIAIDAVDYKPYYLTPSGVYNITVRNWGSSDVTVVSLKLYAGTVLVSSSAQHITIPAQSTVTIHQFLAFKPSEDIHILKVETVEGYTATSDPISSQ